MTVVGSVGRGEAPAQPSPLEEKKRLGWNFTLANQT
jgi:hypothetical protein